MLSDAELEGMAAQCFNMAKLDMELKQDFGFLLAMRPSPSEPLKRFTRAEAAITTRFGEDWLNSGQRKDLVFDGLAALVSIAKPEVVAFGCIVNWFVGTDKLLALDIETQKKMVDTGHNDHHRLAAEGYLRLSDALSVIVQTRERVCTRIQEIARYQFVGKPEVHFADAAIFDGRMKLYRSLDPTKAQ